MTTSPQSANWPKNPTYSRTNSKMWTRTRLTRCVPLRRLRRAPICCASRRTVSTKSSSSTTTARRPHRGRPSTVLRNSTRRLTKSTILRCLKPVPAVMTDMDRQCSSRTPILKRCVPVPIAVADSHQAFLKASSTSHSKRAFSLRATARIT